jgi:hypothetical protein
VRLVLRILCLAGAFCLLPTAGWAEWQLKPFGGLNFGGSTTYIDLEHVAGDARLTFGGSVALLGEVVGLEADFGNTPGYFNGDGPLVLSSRVTTLTGNVIVALPKRIAQYSLRPYVVAGGGLLHTHLEDSAGAFLLSRGLGAVDFGAGVTGFLSDHVGLNWDIRFFKSFEGEEGALGFHPDGPEQLSTWRATMGIVFRP